MPPDKKRQRRSRQRGIIVVAPKWFHPSIKLPNRTFALAAWSDLNAAAHAINRAIDLVIFPPVERFDKHEQRDLRLAEAARSTLLRTADEYGCWSAILIPSPRTWPAPKGLLYQTKDDDKRMEGIHLRLQAGPQKLRGNRTRADIQERILHVRERKALRRYIRDETQALVSLFAPDVVICRHTSCSGLEVVKNVRGHRYYQKTHKGQYHLRCPKCALVLARWHCPPAAAVASLPGSLVLPFTGARLGRTDLLDIRSILTGCAKHWKGSVKPTPSATDEQRPMGVTLLDVALLFNDLELGPARLMVASWHDKKAVKKPKSLGLSPDHAQMHLYELSAALSYAERIEGGLPFGRARMLSELRAKAKRPIIK